MTENASPKFSQTIRDFGNSLSVLLSWERLRKLNNQSIQTKITLAILGVTFLVFVTGFTGIIALLTDIANLPIKIGLIVICMVFSVVAALFAIRFSSRTIIHPMHQLIKSSDRIAGGDFTVELTKKYDDEVGELVDYYNGLLVAVREMMGMLSGEQATAYMAAEENAEAKAYVDRKVKEILDAMDQVSEGNLTVELAIENEDEIGLLYKGFNRVLDRLSEILETVQHSTDKVSGSGHKIENATVQLGIATDNQVKNTDEILEQVELLSASAQSISITSEQTCNIVQDGIDITSSAEKSVGQTVSIMIEIAENAKQSATLISGLNESSEKIGEIVSLIKDIASQTNLLALNAAIEAARAGTHGKGFAVVADEVKKLAERTTISTSEISERITKIQEQTTEVTTSIEEGLRRIENGTQIAQNAQQSLEKVMESTEMGVQMVMQIDASSGMQSASTAEIVRTIKNIVSSINASKEQVGGITSAAKNLSSLTKALKDAANQFSLKNYVSAAEMEPADESDLVRATDTEINQQEIHAI